MMQFAKGFQFEIDCCPYGLFFETVSDRTADTVTFIDDYGQLTTLDIERDNTAEFCYWNGLKFTAGKTFVY